MNGQYSKEVCENDFCFKCHRKENGTEGTAWTVNAISFNTKHNTFCTVGSDGTYIIWNKDSKSRYKQSTESPVQGPPYMPMTNCAFSDDASILVFAMGEDWSMGAQTAAARSGPNSTQIYARKCAPDDVFKPPKSKY